MEMGKTKNCRKLKTPTGMSPYHDWSTYISSFVKQSLMDLCAGNNETHGGTDRWTDRRPDRQTDIWKNQRYISWHYMPGNKKATLTKLIVALLVLTDDWRAIVFKILTALRVLGDIRLPLLSLDPCKRHNAVLILGSRKKKVPMGPLKLKKRPFPLKRGPFTWMLFSGIILVPWINYDNNKVLVISIINNQNSSSGCCAETPTKFNVHNPIGAMVAPSPQDFQIFFSHNSD